MRQCTPDGNIFIGRLRTLAPPLPVSRSSNVVAAQPRPTLQTTCSQPLKKKAASVAACSHAPLPACLPAAAAAFQHDRKIRMYDVHAGFKLVKDVHARGLQWTVTGA
jgi:hypothetical protein